MPRRCVTTPVSDVHSLACLQGRLTLPSRTMRAKQAPHTQPEPLTCHTSLRHRVNQPHACRSDWPSARLAHRQCCMRQPHLLCLCPCLCCLGRTRRPGTHLHAQLDHPSNTGPLCVLEQRACGTRRRTAASTARQCRAGHLHDMHTPKHRGCPLHKRTRRAGVAHHVKCLLEKEGSASIARAAPGPARQPLLPGCTGQDTCMTCTRPNTDAARSTKEPGVRESRIM